MGFWKNVGTGFRGYGRSFEFIFNKGLWVYFFYPLAIMLLLFLGGYALIHHLSDEVEKWMMNVTGLGGDAEGFFSFLKGVLSFFVTIAVNIIFWFVFSTFSKYITLILLSPLLALLSEKTERLLTGKKYPFNADQFVRDVWRGILIALRNMLIEFAIIIGSFILIFIPVIGFFVPVFLFFVSAYFYGFSMMDYTSERRRLNISQSVAFIRGHKGTAITNGSIYLILLWIPFAGIIFAPVFAAVAATLSVQELVENKNSYNG